MRSWREATRAVPVIGLALALSSCSVVSLLPGRDTTSEPPPPPATSASGEARADASRVAERVTTENLASRLQHLETLTMEAGGNRSPGSQGYSDAAAYIEQELAATGFYDVHREPFTIHVPHAGASDMVTSDGRSVNQNPLTFSPGTPPDGVRGALVAPASGLGCTADDWGPEAAGQIGIVDRGSCTFVVKTTTAANAGLVALVIVNSDETGLYGTLGNSSPDFIPVTGVTAAEGRQLRADMTEGVGLTFTFEQRIETFDTFNLFAESRGGRADNIVMAGAHLDSVPEGPGINDNGSGSMALLETAIQLAADGDQPANKVRFAWWGGEELGLLGSIHWTNSLVATSPDDLRAIAAYVNTDMVASPNYVIGVYDGDGSTFGTDGVPAGSDGIDHLFTDWFDSIGQPWVDSELTPSSDHAALVPSGVPVGGLFTGAGDEKTGREQELFGGTAGQDYDPNYHRPSDTFANAGVEALGINGRATAFVVASLAADTTAVNGTAHGNDGTPTAAEGYGYAGTT